MKYHYVRRYQVIDGMVADNGIVDIPENQLAETLKLHPDWLDLGEVGQEVVEEQPLPEIKDGGIECPLCGFQAKNDKSLRMHKMKAH